MNKIDFMIEIIVTSMDPNFKNCDFVACTILRNSNFMQWNRCYIIATKEQGILLKRLLPGEDTSHLVAVSDNKEFPPFKIPVDDITGIAMVAGLIRLE
ncbi:MAG: S24 family peptidase [Bacteroidales bacterium]